MKVFILEDDESRCTWFRKAFIGHVAHFADNVETAKEMLSNNVYDAIFLDHDLAEEHYVAMYKTPETPLVGTGYDAVQWMIRNNNNKQAEVIIHSLNPAGSARMHTHLTVAGYNAKRVTYLDLRKKMTVYA